MAIATWHMEETHLHMNVAMITNFARKNVQLVVLCFCFNLFVFIINYRSISDLYALRLRQFTGMCVAVVVAVVVTDCEIRSCIIRFYSPL